MSSPSMISIYIPRVKKTTHQQNICAVFMNLGIIVHCIDIVPIHKEKHGFTENFDNSDYMSAFVYGVITHPAENEMYVALWLCECSEKNTAFKLQVSQSEYWMLLKNKNPIPRTMMNIHQVVENARYLETKVEEQEKLIQENNRVLEKNFDENTRYYEARVEGLEARFDVYKKRVEEQDKTIQAMQDQITVLYAMLNEKKLNA